MRVKDLDPSQFARLSTLLDHVLALAPERREAWLATIPAENQDMVPLVRELMTSLSAAEDDRLLETRDVLQRQIAAATGPPVSLVGRHFGPYRVLRELGRGGMGSVWLAERADGLFARSVALKLVHAHLAGPTLTERFARERAILAGLNHPHIARLLDAGYADDGQPYLAIDYVEGTPLTAYCDAHRLSLADRIRLVVQVLSAIQHAHRNLVIHRDLKPSNILVTLDGDVRLLDFGIAKLMQDGQTRETELTELGGRALTPDYASPEQIAGQPLTTASDVYALGVILYELLCGNRPYRLKRDSRGALEEAILTVEATRPSQSAITDDIARARATTVGKLRQALAGDLDTITAKALKKDPAERYGSAEAFMQDLQRFVAGEPVQARPDSAWYRLRKFVGRNRIGVGVATVTGVALVAATGVSLWQAQVAREQAVAAKREAKRAQAVQEFLVDIFRANSDTQDDPIKARQTTARELLDIGARRLGEKLKNAPEVQVEVADTLADMYQQLGLDDETADLLVQEIKVQKQLYGATDRRVAETLLNYAGTLFPTKRRADGYAALTEAKQILDAAHDDTSRTRGVLLVESARYQLYTSLPQMQRDADAAVRLFRAHFPDDGMLVTALRLAARSRYAMGDYAGSETVFKEALDDRPGGGDHSLSTLITLLVELADSQLLLVKPGEAEANLRLALAESRRRNGELHVDTLHVETRLGALLHATSRRAEGRALLASAFGKLGKGSGTDTPNVIYPVHRNYANGLLADGHIDEAAQIIAGDVALVRERESGSTQLANILRSQAGVFVAQGRHDDALRALDEAAALLKTASGGGAEPSTYNGIYLETARIRLAQGNAAGAIEQIKRVSPPKDAEGLPLRLDEVAAGVLTAQALLQEGRTADAQRSAQEALDAIVRSPVRNYYQTREADASLSLGEAERQSGQYTLARAHLRRAADLRAANDDPVRSPWLAEAKIALAACLLDQGQHSAARVLVNEAAAIEATNRELGEQFRAPLRDLQARLRRG
jgi:eukaryotic-like serine/threonine-protein kinase